MARMYRLFPRCPGATSDYLRGSCIKGSVTSCGGKLPGFVNFVAAIHLLLMAFMLLYSKIIFSNCKVVSLRAFLCVSHILYPSPSPQNVESGEAPTEDWRAVSRCSVWFCSAWAHCQHPTQYIHGKGPRRKRFFGSQSGRSACFLLA